MFFNKSSELENLYNCGEIRIRLQLWSEVLAIMQTLRSIYN